MVGAQALTLFRRAIEIEELPKTVNSMGKASIWSSHAERHKWRTMIRIQSRNLQPPYPLLKANLVLTRCSAREPDLDNLYASFKFVIDGLVFNEILIDDKPSNINLICKWEKAPMRNGKIRIEIDGHFDPNWVRPIPKLPRTKTR